jgi:hypothetical protein
MGNQSLTRYYARHERSDEQGSCATRGRVPSLSGSDAFVIWLPPDSMRGVVHAFDGREGGSFGMSLLYPEGDRSTTEKICKHSAQSAT